MPKLNQFAHYQVAKLDNRPFPEKTYTPSGILVCGHQLQISETKGGILLPTGQPLQKQHETSRIKIIAIGPDVTKCKIGDIVLISDVAPSEIVIHRGHVTVIFNQDHFIGVEDPLKEEATDPTGPQGHE